MAWLPRGWWGGTRCCAQRFDLQFTPSRGSALQCLCLWDSCMSRAWRWAPVRTMRAAGVLSAKPCVCSRRMQEAALPCASTLVFLFLCFWTPWVLQYPAWASQAPTRLEGEGIKLTPCHILIQCRRAKGFVPQNGVSGTPRPFAEEHPWAVPMGAVELPMAGSPFPVLRLPESLETHQRLSPAPCLDRAGNDPFALEGSTGKRSVPGLLFSLLFL